MSNSLTERKIVYDPDHDVWVLVTGIYCIPLNAKNYEDALKEANLK